MKDERGRHDPKTKVEIENGVKKKSLEVGKRNQKEKERFGDVKRKSNKE